MDLRTALFFGVLVVVIVLVIAWSKRRGKEIAELKKRYEHLLLHGTKQQALQAGRDYYAALRGGRLSAFDEQAISNDLGAMG